jgi:hypothetical protein
MELKKAGIKRKRISVDRNWALCSREELLGHAYYLLGGIRKYVKKRNKVGKTGRHLGSVQTILMAAGWQTLRDSMEHNRPKT